MKKTAVNDASPAVSAWALTLGIAGFAGGFFGPMLLNPEANQGPMLGIFITGPGGALLGLVLGLIFKWMPLAPTIKWTTLLALTGFGLLTILYFSFPEPRVLGYIIDAKVAHCSAPSEHLHEATAYWEKRIEATPWAKPRSGWKDDTARMLQDEGAVLELSISREANVLELRKPWNKGKLTASAWHEPRQRTKYFARFNGSDCSGYQGDLGLLYVATGQASSAWPPTDLQNFLNVALIDPAPGRYKSLVE